MKKWTLLLYIIILSAPVYGQKGNNLLKKPEEKLLNLLLDDTVNSTSFTLPNTFNFGLDNQLFTNTNLIKKGKILLIQPLGTGQLYNVTRTNGHIQLKRIDQTIHSGVNFFAQNFFIKDTLYQFGGLGFWQIRGIISYFSKQTNQWELLQANRSIPSYFDDQRDAIIHFDDSRTDPKIYITNSYYYPNYPSSFETSSVDSCYSFNFHTREWKALGKLDPACKKFLESNHSRTIEIHHKNLYIFQTQLMFYWIDFEKNQLGQLSAKENDKLRQMWLAFYNNDRTRNQFQFQFNLGNELYYAKMPAGQELQFTKTTIDLNALSQAEIIQVYTNKISIFESLYHFLGTYKTYLFLIIIFILTIFGIRTNLFRKKRMPKEFTTILYQNFYTALNIIEKELIEALYQSNLKGEELSTKTINKIIGVQQKDTLTQNKSRSDHFIKINQKFKMATQNTEPLIIKNRDKADKRQYNYDLNDIYISEIEKLLKE